MPLSNGLLSPLCLSLLNSVAITWTITISCIYKQQETFSPTVEKA